MNLRDKIMELIELKQEGGYWDFKRQWHESKGDLLHDIICMANNLEDNDAYIIIGVDEENNCKIKNVLDDPNRKNTQMLVDFLKDKKFAGDIRPVVKVENLQFYSATIDVVVIKNSPNTPFYLKERFQDLSPNYIYTRVQDNNTPKNMSADINNVEWLWKKRLGLHLNPLERLELYIQKSEDWNNGPDGEMDKFYAPFPEYTISYDFVEDGTNGYQTYLFSQVDYTPHWMEIQIKYYQTLLMKLRGVALDGGRYFTPCPRKDSFPVDENARDDIYFHYMDKDSLLYKLNEFFYQHELDCESDIARRRFFNIVLLFEDRYEREEFKNYAISKWESFKEEYSEKINTNHIPQFERYKKDAFKEDYRNEVILKKMLTQFRQEK